MDLAGSFSFITPLLIFTSLKATGFTQSGLSNVLQSDMFLAVNISPTAFFALTPAKLMVTSCALSISTFESEMWIIPSLSFDAVALMRGTLRLSRTLTVSHVNSGQHHLVVFSKNHRLEHVDNLSDVGHLQAVCVLVEDVK